MYTIFNSSPNLNKGIFEFRPSSMMRGCALAFTLYEFTSPHGIYIRSIRNIGIYIHICNTICFSVTSLYVCMYVTKYIPLIVKWDFPCFQISVQYQDLKFIYSIIYFYFHLFFYLRCVAGGWAHCPGASMKKDKLPGPCINTRQWHVTRDSFQLAVNGPKSITSRVTPSQHPKILYSLSFFQPLSTLIHLYLFYFFCTTNSSTSFSRWRCH